MEYYCRNIDNKLLEWKNSAIHKPLIIRGARQVGKSSTVQNLAKHFDYFAEVNLEKRPELRNVFNENIDVQRICRLLSATLHIPCNYSDHTLMVDERANGT